MFFWSTDSINTSHELLVNFVVYCLIWLTSFYVDCPSRQYRRSAVM